MLIYLSMVLLLQPIPTDRINKKDNAELIWITPSSFIDIMGKRRNLNGFWIYKYEVTNEQFARFCDETNRDYPSDPDDTKWELNNYMKSFPKYPVVNITWQEAKSYASWAGGRLPTEMEWEIASEVDYNNKYIWGNSEENLENLGNIAGQELKDVFPGWTLEKHCDNFKWTSPVGSFRANRNGIYDMTGNAFEWCDDWFYDKDEKKMTFKKVLKGGSYSSYKEQLSAQSRFAEYPVTRSSNIGFRIVMR
ncbi:MAG: SUMF1/EgtB/PvdO family nonheme iron enzyme [Candidatus Coatesbacteria bacterium]|nr:SUMF1/EgtB/PvdO family nonheme iron enzyme [Candidatus Coatesbacteria bacterium]